VSSRVWYPPRRLAGYFYLGFITVFCGVGSFWAWRLGWDDGTRFAVALTGGGAYCTLLAVGDLMFRMQKPTEDFVVRVVLPDQTLELPCSTYEAAFKVALYAQLLGFEHHRVWLDVSITPDRPEPVRK
jgi:hypothetical protein